MVNARTVSLAINSVCLGICVLVALLAVVKIRRAGKKFSSKILANGYTDEDGTSPPWAIAAFRDRLPRILLVLGVGCALICSITGLIVTVAVEHEVVEIEAWFSPVGWVLALVVASLLNRQSSPVLRWDLGFFTAIQAVSLVIALGSSIYFGVSTIQLYTDMIQGILGIVVAFSSLSLPRRPAVIRDGRLVDAQFDSSAIARYSLAWGKPLLDKARIQGSLEYTDLPLVDSSMTAKNLHHDFQHALVKNSSGRGLWYIIFKAQQWKFIRQAWVATLQGFVSLVPQMCMFKILQQLERRSAHEVFEAADLWLYVLALGVSKIAYLQTDAWISWINHCLIEYGTRVQLSAVVFDKVMRMKDIKHVRSISHSGGEDAPSPHVLQVDVPANILTPLLAKSEGGQEEAVMQETAKSESDDNENAPQGAVNLLTVDVDRVSRLASDQYMLIDSTIRIVVGITILIGLIGFWSTIAGLLVAVLFQPLNKILNEWYNEASLAVMSARDEKTHTVSEALHGIRQIKISAIEVQWQKLIMQVRERELNAQRWSYICGTILDTLWMVMPTIFSTASLGVYAWLNNGLTASVAFTALALFTAMEAALMLIPMLITDYIDAFVSCGRLQKHLEDPDQRQVASPGDTVSFDDATISWPSAEHNAENIFKLQDVTLTFPNGELSIIHGHTGCGKSLLLAAIIGEADLLSGKMTLPPSKAANSQTGVAIEDWSTSAHIAFVAQVPWIENASIKDNILYGLPLNPGRYQTVLQATALEQDLAMLTDGENTEVGATGINLSGGQRWRLTFARALYSRAAILVLDDIFSAVDAHVGRHIFEYGICGELGLGRTIILVTHHIGLVIPQASYVVEIGKDGRVEASTPNREAKLDLVRRLSRSDNALDLARTKSSALVGLDPTKEGGASPAKFVETETREQGRVKWKVYRSYMKASGGYLFWIFIILSFAISAGIVLGRSYWVRIWSEEKVSINAFTLRSTSKPTGNTYEVHPNNTTFYLAIYLAISLSVIIITAIKVGVTMLASLRASRRLFADLTFNVLRAPLRWLDTVPVGRILNRFVGDFELVDSELGQELARLIDGILALVGIIIAGLFVSAWISIPIAILMILCVLVARVYVWGARDIKRLESNAKSPVFDLVGSALLGLATIRSFGKREEYVGKMYMLLDQYARTSWSLELSVAWMEVRQGLLGIAFTLCIAVGVVCLDGIDPSLAGFALGFSLQYSEVIVLAILRLTHVELAMNATERIVEYIEMPIETQDGVDVPAAWPAKGRIEVTGLEVGYAAHLPSVLKDISFTVEPRQRIGVVGRTGSGKSSLTLSIFRFLEARSGSITIDGVDISQVKLEQLRSRLAIIPQDPVLFSGTLRSNVDPFDEHTDAEVFSAMRRVHLLSELPSALPSGSATPTPGYHTNVNPFRNLSYPISRGGLNLSQGQRQLLCLARALIARPKILVLDEATSSVDMATDALVQRSIREEFADCSLLVIAHRLSTIADFDKVLVLGDGKVLEFGPPKELVTAKGAFYDMVLHSGEREVIEDSFAH